MKKWSKIASPSDCTNCIDIEEHFRSGAQKSKYFFYLSYFTLVSSHMCRRGARWRTGTVLASCAGDPGSNPPRGTTLIWGVTGKCESWQASAMYAHVGRPPRHSGCVTLPDDDKVRAGYTPLCECVPVYCILIQWPNLFRYISATVSVCLLCAQGRRRHGRPCLSPAVGR